MQNFFQKLIGLLVLFFVIESQSQNFQLTNYSLNEGLPKSQVKTIIQDAVGFIWFGTNGGGVCSFDGKEFKVWDRSNGLISNYINDIKYFEGRLYIATNKGLSIKENGIFINYSTSKINKIIIEKGVVYLAMADGLKLFDGLKITDIKLSKPFDKINVFDIAYKENYLWLATDKGLYKIDVGQKLNNNLKLFSKGNFISIQHYNNKIYAINYDKGISVFNSKGGQLKEIGSQQRISSLDIIDDVFWVSTKSSEVLVLNNIDYGLIKRYNSVSGIKSNINKVLKDRQGNFWLATNGAGVYKLKEHNFKLLFEGNSISSSAITSNEIWFSSNQYLTKIDSLGIHDRSFGVNIVSIAKNKNLTFAGTNHGLFILDVVHIIDTLNITRGLVSNILKKVIIKDNEIWITYKNKGISSFKYDLTTKSIFNVIDFGTSDGLYDLSINDIKFDTEGTIWYVSKKGFFGYIKNNIVKHLGRKLNVSFTINNLLIHNNKLFVGTEGDGIWMAELSDELKFKNLTFTNSLNSKTINQLLFDAENNLWAGTQYGVYKIKFSSNYNVDNITHFGYNDGFIGIETTPNTSFMDKYSNLYFGTTKGLAVYQINNISSNEVQKFPIEFETVEVVYNSIDSINLINWTNSSKVLNLKPEENHVSFSYRSIDINHPQDIKYRWRLNTTAWSNWSGENKINFANLNAGNYSFEVESRTINFQKSNAIHFNFHIKTKLIDTLWFRWSVLSFLSLILFFLIWNYIRKIKIRSIQKNEKLKLENHLLSLEHKALQLQMNPHFIFNVLNGIKAMSKTDILKMNTTINKFALMLRGILNNSRKETISLHEEIETLNNYIEVEQLMRSNPFNFKINIGKNIDIEEVSIPVMLIQPFVENAIKHGFVNNAIKGELEISFSVYKELLYCEIKDNGVGFYRDKKSKIKTNHQSVALEVTKERITSIAGKDTLVIKELKDENLNVTGTLVQFRIPLLTDY